MMPALFSGVSGLKNHQFALNVIANNLANVNTIGYKFSRVTFSDLVYQNLRDASAPQGGSGGTNPVQIGLGSLVSTVDSVNSQGNLESTGQSTDMAIQGNGYFVVGDNTSLAYSRAGNMLMGQDGDLYNPSTGFKFKGWQATNGVVSTSGPLTNINIPIGQSLLPANATTTMSLKGNLDATAAVGGTAQTTTQVYDSLGNLNTVQLTYTKTAANAWDWAAVDGNGNSVGTGTLSFTNAGVLSGSTGSLSLTLTNGAVTPLNVATVFTGATQYAGASSLVMDSQDGYAAATLSNFTVGQGGEITGVFTNGKNQLLGQLALATFKNPGALVRDGRNLLSESSNSGTATLGTPNSGGRGSIVGGTLEMSNVDVAQQFTDMIVAQRGFQANSKVITTSDQMLQELVNLKQ